MCEVPSSVAVGTPADNRDSDICCSCVPSFSILFLFHLLFVSFSAPKVLFMDLVLVWVSEGLLLTTPQVFNGQAFKEENHSVNRIKSYL